MTTPIPLRTSSEMVAAEWIATIPGFSRGMTGTRLPPDVLPPNASGQSLPAPWLETGFVTVEVVGGNPDPLLPVRRPVMGVKCWAALPGSNDPPWYFAQRLASAITFATWDRTTLSRPLTPVVNGVTYPVAVVQGIQVLTEFRRLYDDAADYACYQGDLWMSWVAPGDRIT